MGFGVDGDDGRHEAWPKGLGMGMGWAPVWNATMRACLIYTLLQKRKEVRFEFPATIPVPHEPPGSGL